MAVDQIDPMTEAVTGDVTEPVGDRSGLSLREIVLLAAVLGRHPQVRRGVLFGSRAKGTARANSDIDLALYGNISDMLVERIALELDELPLPYLFDLKAMVSLKNAALIDHIERAGVEIYPNHQTGFQPRRE